MKTTKTVMTIGVISVLALCIFSPFAGQAQAKYPEKTITFIVPMGAGGGTDGMARALASRLEKELGVTVVVTNEQGSGGRRGSIALYKSPPDGYTIGFPHIATLIFDDTLGETKSPIDYKKFAVALKVDTATFFMYVAKNQPFKALADLKGAGQSIKFGSSGIGTPSWLVPTALGASVGFKAGFVSGHKNLPEVALAVARGDVIGGTGSYTHFRGVINDIRPLVYMSDKKSFNLPEIPTIKSLGYPKLASLGVPWAVAAPPRTPEDRLEVLRAALRKVIQREEFIKWAQDAGYDPDTMDPKTFWKSMEDMKEVYLSCKPFMEKK